MYRQGWRQGKPALIPVPALGMGGGGGGDGYPQPGSGAGTVPHFGFWGKPQG